MEGALAAAAAREHRHWLFKRWWRRANESIIGVVLDRRAASHCLGHGVRQWRGGRARCGQAGRALLLAQEHHRTQRQISTLRHLLRHGMDQYAKRRSLHAAVSIAERHLQRQYALSWLAQASKLNDFDSLKTTALLLYRRRQSTQCVQQWQRRCAEYSRRKLSMGNAIAALRNSFAIVWRLRALQRAHSLRSQTAASQALLLHHKRRGLLKWHAASREARHQTALHAKGRVQRGCHAARHWREHGEVNWACRRRLSQAYTRARMFRLSCSVSKLSHHAVASSAQELLYARSTRLRRHAEFLKLRRKASIAAASALRSTRAVERYTVQSLQSALGQWRSESRYLGHQYELFFLLAARVEASQFRQAFLAMWHHRRRTVAVQAGKIARLRRGMGRWAGEVETGAMRRYFTDSAVRHNRVRGCRHAVRRLQDHGWARGKRSARQMTAECRALRLLARSSLRRLRHRALLAAEAAKVFRVADSLWVRHSLRRVTELLRHKAIRNFRCRMWIYQRGKKRLKVGCYQWLSAACLRCRAMEAAERGRRHFRRGTVRACLWGWKRALIDEVLGGHLDASAARHHSREAIRNFRGRWGARAAALRFERGAMAKVGMAKGLGATAKGSSLAQWLTQRDGRARETGALRAGLALRRGMALRGFKQRTGWARRSADCGRRAQVECASRGKRVALQEPLMPIYSNYVHI